MGIEKGSSSKSKSNQWIWWVVAVIIICLALACCLLVVAGILLLRPANQNIVPGPPANPTSPLPTESVYWVLNVGADPLYGSISLQRGFSPDPHITNLGAGGTVDTSGLNLDCGFTTAAPSFGFKLSGGASEGFLRIFFIPGDGSDTTLVLHTPGQDWICVDDSSYGIDPVIDIEFAPSGEYTVWVGMRTFDTYAPGTLFITQSENNTP